MRIKIVAFGIARDILQASHKTMEVMDSCDIRSLKSVLCREYKEFASLRKFSLAVNEEYQKDAFVLNEGDEVVIIPPVSGG